MMTKRTNQRGAALLVVLLLSATLSFVALATMEKISLTAARVGNVSERSEALWEALAIEVLAKKAIETAFEANNSKMSSEDPWANKPIELPLDNGFARVVLDDATACFNLNSLAQSSEEDADEKALNEFVRLASLVGLSEFEAQALGQSIADWIDFDNQRRPQGAEDEYYTTRPSPYRTANQIIPAVSEIRAVRGVSQEIYLALEPYVCALENTGPSPVNVNMLERRDAPILAAILGDDISMQKASDIIGARPPGGYTDISGFLNMPAIKELDLPNEITSRFHITSRYLRAHAEIVYDRAVFNMTSELALDGARARIVSRRIGAEK
ncbi:type II secretion system minor pseudopilin GspK [Hyphococcus formosus]|uniref:type II secretion system minor pseudopilin GspK n=1 Tax=Hyphococcus formosus TaxID=3143534 RepID=UPI00398B0E93